MSSAAAAPPPHRLDAHIENTSATATSTTNNALELLCNPTNISTLISHFNIQRAANKKRKHGGIAQGNALQLPMHYYTSINRLPLWVFQRDIGSAHSIDWAQRNGKSNCWSSMQLTRKNVFAMAIGMYSIQLHTLAHIAQTMSIV